MPRVRIVIGEDHYLILEGIRAALADTTAVEIVGVAGDLSSLRAAVDEADPDVVLTDIRMPPTGTDEGIRFAEELRDSHPRVGVVVLSQYDQPEYALRLLERGSSRRAYLLKERIGQSRQLAHAIHEVAEGRSVIDPAIVEGILVERQRRADSSLGSLTPREREVLSEVAQGKSNGAIGESLHLSKRAVEKHINAIFVKLDMPPDDRDLSRRVAATLLFLSEAPRTN